MIWDYEKIRSLRKEGILFADKRCRRLYLGEVLWSQSLQIAHNTIQLWTIVRSRKKGIKISTRQVSHFEKKAGISNSLHFNLLEVEQILKESYGRYY